MNPARSLSINLNSARIQDGYMESMVMDTQEQKNDTSQDGQEETRRLWITPAFERGELKDALSGYSVGSDGFDNS